MQNSSKNRSTSILPLLWVMLFDHTSLNMTFPVLTLLFFDAQSSLFAADTALSVRSMWYGLCVAVPHIVNILMTPILSALSDLHGRKKILIIGTLGAFLFALTAGLGILWGMLSLLFLGRVIQGAFSRTNPIAQAVIGDISHRENKVRNMGYLQLAISLGAFAGPLLGGYFANQFFFKQLNFSLPYFIAAFFGGLSCFMTLTIFKETMPVTFSTSAKKLGSFKNVILNKEVQRISIILLLSQISWSTYYQFMPPILKTTLAFDAHSLGLFVGLVAFWLALATGFGIRFFQQWFSIREMLFLSLYLVLIGLICSFVFCYLHLGEKSNVFIWLSAIPTAMGDVIAYSCLTTLYSDVVRPDEQGKVMGICSIVVAVIWSLTALLGGLMMSVSVLLPLIVAPLGIIVSIMLLHWGFALNKKELF
ncbi:MAG: MFS transporter [Gammaproteobacteria bacterium]|nr:MFS transporter [Gammaproteobacteria bacterium]